MERLIASVTVFFVWGISTTLYRNLNHGLSKSARHQQATRMGIASLLSMLPWIIAGELPVSIPAISAGIVSLLTAVTYPLLYHLSNRRTSPDYDNYMDITLGLYMFGIYSAVLIGGARINPVWAGAITAAMECVMLFIALSQWVYYAMYHGSVDSKSIEVVLNTNVNEILEFGKYYNPLAVTGVIAGIAGITAVMFYTDMTFPAVTSTPPLAVAILMAVYLAAMYMVIFRSRHSALRCSGVMSLIYEVKEFKKANSHYLADTAKRLEALVVRPVGPAYGRPSTILIVIGESASRDHISAFTDMSHETSPWLGKMAHEGKILLYPNSYSCAIQTVPAVKMMMTEANQYGSKPFAKSCSLIDVAHKLGYKVHWYSNQGHLGAFDTPVTMIAETADTAKWTAQQLNIPKFDESLIDFLDEVNPAENNLIVLHLKGNHFNYLNRFPADRRVWDNTAGENEDVTNYHNSLRYTDSVLAEAFGYASEKLHLDAMLYVSDHGENPLKRRSPKFDGYENTRIPMALYLSDDFRRLHPVRTEALENNRDKYFTNDLTYDLVCGIFDIESENFNPSQSLAYSDYRFRLNDMLTYEGRIKVADDPKLK